MDYWNLKAPPIWDFSEFPCQETVDGSTSASSMPQGEGDFSVDLKLGQVRSGSSVVYEAEGSKKGVSLVVAGPTKRARAVNNNNNNNVGHGHGLQASVCCLVDGCYADLSNCREYHRRHKVCELHSKTPEVTIAGHKQRFCQQCSRFHALEEFDEGKRSCRKRLEGHNRRRRKPQPDPPLMLPVDCLSNYQSTRSSPFSNTNHIYSSAAVGIPIWVGVDNNPEAAASAAHYNQQMHCFHNILPSCHPGSPSSSSSSTSTMSFSLLHGSQALPSRAISLLETGSSSNHHHHNNNNNNNSSNMYCEGLSLQVHHDTDHCAPSLLSPPQPPPHMNMMQTPTTTTGLNSGGGGMVQGRTSSSKHGILMAAAAAADSVQMVSASQCSSRGAIFDDQHSPPTLPFHWD